MQPDAPVDHVAAIDELTHVVDGPPPDVTATLAAEQPVDIDDDELEEPCTDCDESDELADAIARLLPLVSDRVKLEVLGVLVLPLIDRLSGASESRAIAEFISAAHAGGVDSSLLTARPFGNGDELDDGHRPRV